MPRKKVTEENPPEKKKAKKRKTIKKKLKESKEVVIPADLPEEEKASVSQKNEQARYRSIGSYSAEIENEFAYANLSQDEAERSSYRYMRRCLHNGEILVGRVIGIADDPKRRMLGAKLAYEPVSNKNHYGMLEVTIPEQVFFEPDTIFARGYDEKSPEDQYRIRKNAILQYLGAKIHFCVIGVSRDKVNNPDDPDLRVTTVLGDRTSAMAKLRDRYFFHRNIKDNETPITIRPGDIVEAFVVNVNFDSIKVVSLGVETKIFLSNLTRDDISSCHQFVKNGDVLPECAVLGVEAKDGVVSLKLTNNRSKAPKMILSMKKGYYYRGRVVFYNRNKDAYTVILDNGVTAFIFRSNVISCVELSADDIVSVYVTVIFENKVGGYAVKL